MKTLLIPPILHLDLASDREFHLTLAHLYKHPRYSEFYLQEAQKGKYIILDNSAHEFQVGESAENLLRLALEVQASEIVLPDHLFDGFDTIIRTKAALEYIGTHPVDKTFQYMIVPQGQSFEEYSWCLSALVDVYFEAQVLYGDVFPHPPVLGVSKDYEMWDGGLLRILEEVVLPCSNTEMPIHMLGWGRNLWDLGVIAEKYSHLLRSVDSAKPIVYGLNNIRLYPGEYTPAYPTRSKSYFFDQISEEGLQATEHNIEIFDILVQSTSQNDHDLSG